MGCWFSKHDDTELIALCRRRRDLIREAFDLRYALAASHAAYFRTIATVGDVFIRYAREGFPKASTHAKENDVHVVTLPISRKNMDVDGSGESSATPLSHSLSDEGGHLLLSSDESAEAEAETGKGKEGGQRPGLSPNYYYMRSTAIPSMVYYGNPFGGNYGYPGSDVNYSDYYYGLSVSPPAPARVSSPPTPQPPSSQGFTWDFFNPFYSYEQFLPGRSTGPYGMTSMGSSPSSSEVRAREGIPDLEDERELEPIAPVKMGKMNAEDFNARNSVIGSSKNVQKKESQELEKTSKWSPGEKASKVRSAEKGSNGSFATSVVGSSGEQGPSSKKRGKSFQEQSSLASDKGATDEGLVSIDGTRDVVEVLEDIKEGFKSAVISSDAVSKLLEVGKMPYRPRNKLFKVISSRILILVGFRFTSRRLFKHRKHLATRPTKGRLTTVELEKPVCKKADLLSSTLQKLHLWEKKLYEEVKAEERLRVIYEKRCKKLQSLDDKGGEPQKIDAIQVSIRSLRTKIGIAITSVDFISQRMRTIMNEELQPQLFRLIQGLIDMWKLLVAFHQKQLNAIISCRNYTLSVRTAFHDSAIKGAQDLELILVKWHSTFDNWISAQRAFINALNGWLLKWLPEDRESTPDGLAPFSPSRIGAPPLFILTNDWSEAVNSISEAEVKAAIQSFAVNMHNLWESQTEERKQHQKAESLSHEYSTRLKNLQLDQGDEDRASSLNSMKKRLDEAKSRHEETLRHVQSVASVSLKTGLTPIFQSLFSFSSSVLRAYEGVRIPDKAFGS